MLVFHLYTVSKINWILTPFIIPQVFEQISSEGPRLCMYPLVTMTLIKHIIYVLTE